MNIDWQNIDTVLLDMDGTLLDLHFDNFFWLEHLPKRYAAQNQDSHEDVIASLRQQLFDKQGTLEWYCTDYWSRQLGLNIIELKREISHLINERPQVLSFLQALKANNKNCLLITNAHPDSVALKFSVTRIEPLFDKVISSHQYGYPKEALGFWLRLQEECPFDPERTLFIDDSESVLRAAKDYGIAHLLSIKKPDSQRETSPSKQFRSIGDFAEVLSLEAATSHG
ncbi:MAG: GMP/IMP nucleotidase [Porticoccaceae bacterium]|nr:GMP/IMP nucleotidase [Porticoccaceae bacterium]|tara:strand:+ start:3299 stop:3976 length:678 start_codon:yes stop_codon:yes gene_type:complete